MATSIDPTDPIHFAHRLLRARDWQHRPQLDDLCDWWRTGGQGVCALIGMGGAGKTAIAERFLRLLPGAMPEAPDIPKDDSLPPPHNLFVFSFYDAPNPDAFFADLAAWLTDPAPGDAPKTYSYQQTVRLLPRAGDCLLVLDGLEKVQDPGTRGGAFGQITDGRLRDFVVGVAGGWLRGVRVIITTRFRPYDPLAEGCPLYRPIPVEQLDKHAAVALLKERGVHRGTDAQLEAIARDQGFHALSVDLLGGYIARFCEGDPGSLPPDPHDQPAAAIDASLDPKVAAIQKQERKFNRLAERYHEALSRSDPATLSLLQRVCLFRLGIDTETLASIFTGEGKEGISGPELAGLNEKQLRAKLKLLVEMRLLEVGDQTDSASTIDNRRSQTYSVHPAVRDGFIAGLDSETAQRGHDAARIGLEASLGQHLGEYPSDPAMLDLLEEIVYHTLGAGRANEAWDIYWERIGAYKNLLWRLGAYERGERICRAFVPGRSPQTAPLPDALPEHRQPLFINDWALYLTHLGRLDAAARCYERQIEIRVRQEKWQNVSMGYQNLGAAELLAGHLTAGLRDTEEALRLADHAQDASVRVGAHGCRAHALALAGDCRAALDTFGNALDWQRKAEGMADRPLYSDRGYWHTYLLARLGEDEQATQLTETNKTTLREVVGPMNYHEPPCNLLLADLARGRGDLPAAWKLLEKAHEWAIARDAKEPLCWSALVRAKIEISSVRSADQPPTDDAPDGTHTGPNGPGEGGPHSGPYYDARAAIEEGLRIARDCGFGIYHIDLLLTRAQTALYEGKAADAERDVRVALDDGVHPPTDSGLPELLAATDPECGYAWGIAEGRHLLAQTLLLQAAQKVGSKTYKPRSRKTPAEVRELIKAARTELKKCARLRKRIQDPKIADTEQVVRELADGVLTAYPLEPPPVEDTQAPIESKTRDGQPDPQETPTRSKPVAKKHLFLSYCRDNTAEVTKLHADLIAAGEQVWWDKDILPGRKWKLAIRQAMKDSYAVVLCLSRETDGRTESGIFPEAMDAIAAYRKYAPGSIYLIPVRLSECEIPPFEIDDLSTLDSLEYVDLFPSADRNAGLQRLIQALQATPHHP